MKTLLLFLVIGCSNPPSAKTVEADLCQARAVYILTTNGQLDPLPGTPRAKLEAAEDRLCATLPK